MGKLFYSFQSWHFDFHVVFCNVLLLICTLTWRVSNYVSRQGRGIDRRSESTDGEVFLITVVVLMIIPSFVTPYNKKL